MSHHRKSVVNSLPQRPPGFRLFTKESLARIERRVLELRAEAELAAALLKEKSATFQHQQQSGEGNATADEDDRPRPNPSLEAGKKLPPRFGEFPPELYGKPIEDLDEFYEDKYLKAAEEARRRYTTCEFYNNITTLGTNQVPQQSVARLRYLYSSLVHHAQTFIVVARDKMIFRFSATKGLFLLSPFSPVRRTAIYVLTHPFFGLAVMLVILVNCVFMATSQEIPRSEETFTAIYTVESLVKMLARGFILTHFTYLRDAWNWLDFVVVSLAYITMAFPLGNLSALRTFRVLRALKTVAVVPGLKTIVGALMEAVRRLRDVMILTVFVLSIFALVGLQIYQGTLKNKCVMNPESFGWWLPENASDFDIASYRLNESFWLMNPMTGAPKLCSNSSDGSRCPENFTCYPVGENPNYGYTSFDNFGFALLCAFRLMTQDYWENLYQMVLTANGSYHIVFFIIVIFMGSFYLVNLILAIVAMSYDDCQKLEKDEEEAEALEQETMRLAQFDQAADVDDETPTTTAASALAPGRRKSTMFADDILHRHDIEEMTRLKRHRERRGSRLDIILNRCNYAPTSNDELRRLSIVNRCGLTAGMATLSQPGSPRSRSGSAASSKFGWSKAALLPAGVMSCSTSTDVNHRTRDERAVVNGFSPCLDNVSIPYADESTTATPSCNVNSCDLVSRFPVTKMTMSMVATSPHSPISHSRHSSLAATVRGSPSTSGSPRHAGSRPHHIETVPIRDPVQRRSVAPMPLPPSYETSQHCLTTESALLALHHSVTSSREHSIPANSHDNDNQCSNRDQNDEDVDDVKAEQQPLMTSLATYNRKFEPTYFRWNGAAATLRSVGSRRQSTNAVSSGATIHIQTADELDEQFQNSEVRSLYDDVGKQCDNHTRSLNESIDKHHVELEDVLVLKDLINDASTRKTEVAGALSKDWQGCFGTKPVQELWPITTKICEGKFTVYTACSQEHHSEPRLGIVSRSGHHMTWKEKLRRRCQQILFEWTCCDGWYKFAHYVELFIMDAFVDLFITLCIVINTVFMAMDHAGMSDELAKTLVVGNYVFTTIFTAEAALKIIALGLYTYLKDRWSCFDIVIVALSLVELGLTDVKGLSILRSFRLLRVFKLAKSWPTLNLLIGIIGRTMGALGNLCFVLAIIVFIFAVMGKELFGENYKLAEYFPVEPRWNFTDFLHSFMIVFRVLCGEWIESMWDCIHCSSIVCVPFFLLTMIIGNLVVLNLFLALLLSSFGAENLQTSQSDEGTNKLQEAIDRISRFVHFVRSHILVCLYFRLRRKTSSDEFAPKFTKVDFGGRIWFDGVVPVNFGNGGSVMVMPTEVEDDDNHQECYGSGASIGQQAYHEWDDTESKQRVFGGASKPHIAYNSIIAEDGQDMDGVVNSSRVDHVNADKMMVPCETAGVPDNQSLLVAMATAGSISGCGDSSSRSTDIRAMTSRSHTSSDMLASPTIGSTPSVEDDLILVATLTETPGGTKNLLGVEMNSRMRQVLIPDCGASIAGSSLYSPTSPFDDADTVSFERPCLGLGVGGMQSATSGQLEFGPEVNEVDVVFIQYPDDCCPPSFNYLRCMCCDYIANSAICRKFWALRCLAFGLVEHRYFETFIILMIVSSSLALAVEDVNIELEERIILKTTLKYLDKVFTVIFVLEMILKICAYGFKKYFTDAWCWLDFVIVAISLISLGAEGIGLGNIGAFRALRTLRALRPLRAVSRWEGMKVVVNALIQAIPAIFNVLLVCLVFWLIFSIMGVNLFGGRFGSCVDIEGNWINSSIVPNDTVCSSLAHLNYSWDNPKINFDHVLIAYLALFQVATFKGWIDIMKHATDIREHGQQPEREARVYMYLYFVFFIVFGSFFTLNLFIGVIIDNFNMQKKKAGGSMQLFMTEDQKKYYNAMKKLGSKRPQKPIPKPKFKCSMAAFTVATDQKFDIFIMIVILLNMLTMAIEYYEAPQDLEDILHVVNVIFIAIFTAECLLKLIALRHYYFKQPWNVFDFAVVIMSIISLAIKEIIEQYFVSPTLLRVVRVFRVGRILRLIKSAKGIRTLLFSLAVSLPALFNIGLLLFLIMFIYAIFGMSFFMHVKHNSGLDELFNFETFGRSMMLLFQISTSAGWDSALAGMMIDPPNCNDTFSEVRPNGDCGSSGMAVMYLVTYLVVTFLVVINMYIAVILENFSQATEDVEQGLTQDDFDMYYEVWERFDETATQYIPLERLGEFVQALEEPLRLPAPNRFRLIALDIPICAGDVVHCVDILDALTKNFLGTALDTSEMVDLKKCYPERNNYNPISSTLRRQRDDYCAGIIQRAWYGYLERTGREPLPKKALVADRGRGFDPSIPGSVSAAGVDSRDKSSLAVGEAGGVVNWGLTEGLRKVMKLQLGVLGSGVGVGATPPANQSRDGGV